MTAVEFFQNMFSRWGISGDVFVTCLVVFAAVVSIVLVIARTFAEATKASEERLNLEQQNALRALSDISPLSRFVSKGRLFRLRVVAALIPAVIVPTIFFFAGVRTAWVIAAFALFFAFWGWMLPKFYFEFLVKRRQRLFEMDVLDLTLGLDNALRAGMALPQALEKISERMHGVMREELDLVQREYRLGIDLVQALEHLNRRMPCEDVQLIVSAIRITSEAGGSLAEILKEMSEMIRGRREFADKVKTLTAEGRFEAIAMSLAPVAAFVFMYLIQPELMRVLYTTTLGWCALGAVAALEIMGYYVINKIVTIEV